MKKSTLLYLGAITAFLASQIIVFLTFWDYEILKKMPFGISPLVVFAPIFAAIFLTGKANALNNIEHNRPADYILIQSKGWKLFNYIAIGLVAIMAIVLIGKNAVEYL